MIGANLIIYHVTIVRCATDRDKEDRMAVLERRLEVRLSREHRQELEVLAAKRAWPLGVHVRELLKRGADDLRRDTEERL